MVSPGSWPGGGGGGGGGGGVIAGSKRKINLCCGCGE